MEVEYRYKEHSPIGKEIRVKKHFEYESFKGKCLSVEESGYILEIDNKKILFKFSELECDRKPTKYDIEEFENWYHKKMNDWNMAKTEILNKKNIIYNKVRGYLAVIQAKDLLAVLKYSDMSVSDHYASCKDYLKMLL